MPLVKRRIAPSSLSRRPSTWGVTEAGEEVILQGEYDLTAVTNVTLCGALQQLASLVVAAQGVSRGLEEELVKINSRAAALTSRLSSLEQCVARHNPRTVTVPEGDLRTFSEKKNHFGSRHQEEEDLFLQTSRPPEIIKLYADATETPIHIMREIDELRDDGIRSSRFFMCEPVLGDSLKKEKLRKLNLDIETRRPASFVALREWCSDDETLTEVSLAPVSPSVPAPVVTRHQEPAPHKLPSPEQRVLALSLKYPPELVPIDVSGTSFKRLEKFRQSLIHFEYHKGKRHRKRVKRRNTIADTRDARIALADIEASTSSGRGRSSPRSGSPGSRGGASFTDRSFDTSETLDTTSSTTKASSERENHLHVLGLEVSVPVPPRNVHTVSRHMARESNTFRDHEVITHQDAGPSSLESHLVNGTRQAKGLIRDHIYETVKSSKRDSSADKSSQQKSHLPISTQSAAMNVAVKLRAGTRDDGTHSSSGNWSASSSTRTSVESDHHRPVASPTSSLEQDSIQSESFQIRSSSPSSNQRTNSRTTDDFPSTSSHASDGTLTPTQDIQDIPFLDDDTSSAYSCDTEGYYTSFHIDSGLRSVSYEGNKLTGESEYEIFGKGSTGTTNSSASLGTVVMRNPEKKTPPKPPQRVSSLERKQENRESVITVIHVNGSTSSREDVAGDVPDKSGSQDGDSRSSRDGDSGRETSSSPTEPTSPRQPSLPSPELEFSESDLEVDRQEIFRVKTTITPSRIPSMCVITPPQSDDESVRSGSAPISRDSSGSQLDNQGQQAPAQGSHGTLASQGSTSGVTSKLLSFHNSGANSGGATGGGRSTDGGSEKKDVLTRAPQLPHGCTPTLTVIPRSKDGDINAHLKGIMHTAAVASPARPDPEQPVLIRPSLVKQAEREKRLSQESDDKQKTDLQKQLSKEDQSKSQSDKAQAYSSDLVSYKDLPSSTTTASHPFSAVPSNVKQNVVITPTNSLERRKVNTSKPGARVTLNSDGKVVYSSDSLPRSKGHSSFEPGPYIKQVVNTTQPQASGGTSISHTMTVSHMKSSVSTAPSSILHTPLPPPPTTSSTTVTAPQTHPMAHRPQQPLPTSASQYTPQPQAQTQTPVLSSSQSQTVSSKIVPATQPQIAPSSQVVPIIKSHSTPAVQTVPSTQSLTTLQDSSTEPQITTAAQLYTAPTPQSVPSTVALPVLHSSEQQQMKPGLYTMHQKGTNANTDPHNVSMAPALSQSTSVTGQQTRQPQSLPHQRLQQQTLQQPQSPSSQRQVAFALKTDNEPNYLEKHKVESVAGSSNSIYGTTQQHLKQQQQIIQARQEAQRAVQQQQLQQQQLQQQLQQQQLQQQQLQQQQLQQQQLQQQQLQQQQLQQQQLQQQQLKQQQLQQHQQLQKQQLQQQQLQQQLQQRQHLQQQICQSRDEAQRHLQQQQLLLQQPVYQTQQEVSQARQQLIQQTAPPAPQQPVITSAGVIMASQGAPMSPRSQRAGAYVHVQGQATPVVTSQQSTQSTPATAKLPSHPQSAHGYPPGGTTSRAPTPVQGPVTSSPRRGAQPSTMDLTHPHLRTDPGTHFSSAQSHAPLIDQDLDPSTDRVLLALAHARLASQKPVAFTHTSDQVKYGKQSNEFTSKDRSRLTRLNPPIAEMGRHTSSPFQRNNSYKLATAPLSEATNSLLHREGHKNTQAMSYELPVINNSTIHGPRANIGNPGNIYRRLNFSSESQKSAGQGLGQGKTQAQKRPISPFSPGQIVNPNALRHRFYGAQVMVNPAIFNELKSPKATGVTSKENHMKNEVINSEPKTKLNPVAKFSISPAGKPRIVGMVKKPPSPVTDTEIW